MDLILPAETHEELMSIEEQVVEALSDTLKMRHAADKLVTDADAKEAALDDLMTEHGLDAEEMMEKAYDVADI